MRRPMSAHDDSVGISDSSRLWNATCWDITLMLNVPTHFNAVQSVETGPCLYFVFLLLFLLFPFYLVFSHL